MIVFPHCLLIFASDTRHAPSLRFTERFCGLADNQNVFRRDGACPVSEGKDTRKNKKIAKAHFLKDCIFPLLVDICWRHGARPVSTVRRKVLQRVASKKCIFVQPRCVCIFVETGRAPCRKGKILERIKDTRKNKRY